MVKFNKVTWYSQIAAILLGLFLFFLGMYIGVQIEKNNAVSAEVSG